MSRRYEIFENALILVEQIAGSKRKQFSFGQISCKVKIRSDQAKEEPK